LFWHWSGGLVTFLKSLFGVRFYLNVIELSFLFMKLGNHNVVKLDKYEVKSNNGKTSTVHYMKDKTTGKGTDYKFKNHGNDGKTNKLSNSDKTP
jgi:hypothetical protein